MVRLLRTERGFTLTELIIAVSIMTLVASIAVPSFSQLRAQMRAVDDIRTLAEDIGSLRAEAIRMRTSVSLAFTATGYSWDIEGDGTTDGTRTLSESSSWSGALPGTIEINGLGLIRGIVSEQVLAIDNSGHTSSLLLNRNGHLQL